MTNAELVSINRFRAEIEKLETIPDALHTVSKLDVFQLCLKKAGHSQRMQNEAAALKLRAERKAGTLIDDVVPDTPGRRTTETTTFQSLGLTAHYGNKLRKLARIDGDVFEQYLEDAYSRGDEITRAGALRLIPATPRQTVSTFEFVAPSITEEIARQITDYQADELAELIAASIELAIHTMVDNGQKRQAAIWTKRHGITPSGEVGEPWTFAGIAQTIPNERGEPSSREYVENQYYRAHASVMGQLASDGLHHLKLMVQALG